MVFKQKTRKLFDSLGALLRRQKKTVLLVVVVASVTLLLSTLTAIWLNNIYDVRFPSVGTIRTSGVKAYWDAELTNETTEIPWGKQRTGSEPNVTLYLRSVSSMPITLEMTTVNWTLRNSSNSVVFGPSEEISYINMTWDYEGSTLNPGQVIQITFTLHLGNSSSFIEFLINNDVQQFSFDIIIRANEENSP